MFIQDTPPDTTAYMIAGYGLLFAFLMIYLASLFIRTHNLKEDLKVLEGMKGQGQTTDQDKKTRKSKPGKPAIVKPPSVRRKRAKTTTAKANLNKIKKKVT